MPLIDGLMPRSGTGIHDGVGSRRVLHATRSVVWGVCDAAHGHRMFNNRQLSNFKQDGRRPLICVRCEKEDADKEKHLEKCAENIRIRGG